MKPKYFSLFIIPIIVFFATYFIQTQKPVAAAIDYWYYKNGNLLPNVSTWKIGSSMIDAVFKTASTTTLCLIGDSCRTTWPSGSTGTVTSVALTAPTGLTVSGSPITTAGTLALTFTGGYSIPLTASTTEGSTAYTWFQSYYATTTHPLISSLPSLSITKSQVSDFGSYENPLTFNYPLSRATNAISLSDMATSTITCAGSASCGAGSYVVGNALTITGSGLTSYDAWTHPSAGQSATTSLMLFNGNASTTQLTTTGSTYLATTGGNVGIRTTVPLGKLDVGGTGVVQVWSTSIAEVNRRNWGILREQSLVGDWQLAVSTAQGGAPATAVISATKEGNVGIGTTNPNYLLTVYGTASSTIVYAGTLIANTLTAPATFGGRSLTVNGNALDADAELYTDSITFQIASSSVATTSSQSAWQAPVALTITNVNGFCKQGTTTIALDERAETTPKTAGTDIFDDAWETGDYTSTTTFANASIAAGAWINIDVDGFVIGSPQHCRVSVEYTKND